MPQDAPQFVLDPWVQEVPFHARQLVDMIHVEGVARLPTFFFGHNRHPRAGEELRNVEVEVRLLLHVHVDILDVHLRIHQVFEFLDRDLVTPLLIEVTA